MDLYIEQNFFQHMFLDNYIKDGNGNTSYSSCDTFIKLLNNFNNNKKNDYINEIIELFKDTLTIIALNNSGTYQDYKNKIYEILEKKKKVYIAGGWNARNINGHSVGIYIEKKNKYKYDIFIINSGQGINNHYLNGKLNLDENLNGNIIIKYSYIDDDIKTMTNKIITLIKKCLYISSFDDKLSDIKSKLKKESNNKLNLELKNTLNEDDNYNNNYISVLIKKYKGKIFKYLNILNGLLIDNRKYIGCDFIKENNFKYDNYFYEQLNNILKNMNVILIDKIQLSGSCSYFSFYYFIKYKFKDNNIFNEFINSSKKIMLDLAFNDIKRYNSLFINSFYLINLNNNNINRLKKFISNHIIIETRLTIKYKINSNERDSHRNAFLYEILKQYKTIIDKINNKYIIKFSNYISFIKNINEIYMLYYSDYKNDKKKDKYNNIFSFLNSIIINLYKSIFKNNIILSNLNYNTNNIVLLFYEKSEVLYNFNYIHYYLIKKSEAKKSIGNNVIKNNYLLTKIKYLRNYDNNNALHTRDKYKVAFYFLFDFLDIKILNFIDIIDMNKLNILYNHINNDNINSKKFNNFANNKKILEILGYEYILVKSLLFSDNIWELFVKTKYQLFKIFLMEDTFMDSIEKLGIDTRKLTNNQKNNIKFFCEYSLTKHNNYLKEKNEIHWLHINDIEYLSIIFNSINNNINIPSDYAINNDSIIDLFDIIQYQLDHYNSEIIYKNGLFLFNDYSFVNIINNFITNININNFVYYYLFNTEEMTVKNIESELINNHYYNKWFYNGSKFSKLFIVLLFFIKIFNKNIYNNIIEKINKDKIEIFHNIILLFIKYNYIPNYLYYYEESSIVYYYNLINTNNTIYEFNNKKYRKMKCNIFNKIYNIVDIYENIINNEIYYHNNNIYIYREEYYSNSYFTDIYFEKKIKVYIKNDYDEIYNNNIQYNIIINLLINNNILFLVCSEFREDEYEDDYANELRNNYIYIYLLNYKNLIIRIDDHNQLLLHDSNQNETYYIILDKSFYKDNILLSQWMFNFKNRLLLKNIKNIKNDYIILILKNIDDKIDHNIYFSNDNGIGESEFSYSDRIYSNIIKQDIENFNFANRYTYIKLHYTYMYPLNNDINELTILIMSLFESNNFFYIDYFFDKYLILLNKIFIYDEPRLIDDNFYSVKYDITQLFLKKLRNLYYSNVPIWIYYYLFKKYTSNELYEYINTNITCNKLIDYRYNNFIRSPKFDKNLFEENKNVIINLNNNNNNNNILTIYEEIIIF